MLPDDTVKAIKGSDEETKRELGMGDTRLWMKGEEMQDDSTSMTSDYRRPNDKLKDMARPNTTASMEE